MGILLSIISSSGSAGTSTSVFWALSSSSFSSSSIILNSSSPSTSLESGSSVEVVVMRRLGNFLCFLYKKCIKIKFLVYIDLNKFIAYRFLTGFGNQEYGKND